MYEEFLEKQFGSLSVKEYIGKRKTKWRTSIYFRCQCECGVVKEIEMMNLVSGHTKSCGCLKRRKCCESSSWIGCGELSGRVWCQIKQKALDRNLQVAITIEEAWQQFQKQDGRCALTGWPIILTSVKGSYFDKTASLDRIDSKLNYTRDNIQWIHKDLNMMKTCLSQDRFIDVCKAVAKHQGSQDDKS